ncbi:MAG: serine hydrolase [Candidatus Omnitrophota bacterium]
MKKLFIFFSLIVFFSIFGCSKENIDVDISAESAVLMSPWTKRVIYSKEPHKKLLPASTVKIMTSLVVVKNMSLKEEMTVSKLATLMEPSKIYVKEGEKYLAEDLIKAMLLNSGNDASVVVAEGIGGSEERFISMMNILAEKIGARDTVFKNPNGLPKEGQSATTYDLGLIVREAMKNKTLVDIMKMKEGEIKEVVSGRTIKLRNHNKSLWKDKPYVILGKTGWTKKAGHCFAGFIEYNRWKKVIVVILKSKSLWGDLERLAESLISDNG